MTALLVILALWVLIAAGTVLIVARICARRDRAARQAWAAAVARSRRLDAEQARLAHLLNGEGRKP